MGAGARGTEPAAIAGPPFRVVVSAIAACICAGAGLGLATHYPILPEVAIALWLAVALGTFGWPLAWLVAVPAALPVLGFMPWTGWLTFEELDLAVTAVAAGGYARMAWGGFASRSTDGHPSGGGATALKAAVAIAYAIALVVSMHRGFADAGGFAWGWWQGYREPMNSVRLTKAFWLALLLAPLWRNGSRPGAARAADLLSAGMSISVAVVGLLTLWERWAHTGLLNFSSDYRTTALFWEMHVGGAALDAWLALSLPFAVREVLRSAKPWPMALAGTAVLLGAYASLTTFSRGVYAAVPAGMLLMGALHARQVRREAPTDDDFGWKPALLVAMTFSLASVAVFPGSGYRGVLAVLGAFALMLPAAGPARALPWRGWAGALSAALALCLLLFPLGYVIPKGPYVAYGIAWVLCATALFAARSGGFDQPRLVPWLWAAFMVAPLVFVIAAIPVIATHWGGPPAERPATIVGVGLGVLFLVACRLPVQPWPASWRWQVVLTGALAIVALMVGVMMGGAYMSDRIGTGERDLETREHHWRQVLEHLGGTTDWILGKGAGRYPSYHVLSADPRDQVGDHRWVNDADGHRLILSAGKHGQSWGVLYRVSQRVRPVQGAVVVRADVRSVDGASLHVELCHKHLLYDDGDCMIGNAVVKGTGSSWQPVEIRVPGRGLPAGDWFAPSFVVFSMAVDSPGQVIEIGRIGASDASGRELLANGDFSRGMAHWFFTSDRNHLAWHTKNMALHVLFEQGLLGLGLLAALVGGALWRVTLGHAREHPLAPPVAASLVGLLVIGLFDSVLDAPRVAFLFYLVVLFALSLPARPGARNRLAARTA